MQLPLALIVVLTGIGGALFAGQAAAESGSRPFWTEQAMFRFGDDLFFTGRASCAPSAEEGRQRAYDAAVQELRNYTRSSELPAVTIETQMVFEETRSSDSPEGKTTVWRLLRAPAGRLNKAARSTSSTSVPAVQIRPAPTQTLVVDLTPRVGMTRDQVFNTFGQPKSIAIKRGSIDVLWEYPATGLRFVFNADGILKRWRLAGAHTLAKKGESIGASPESQEIIPAATSNKEPVVDLTDRLRALQSKTPSDGTQSEAEQICTARWPRNADMQRSCIQQEDRSIRRQQQIQEQQERQQRAREERMEEQQMLERRAHEQRMEDHRMREEAMERRSERCRDASSGDPGCREGGPPPPPHPPFPGRRP